MSEKMSHHHAASAAPAQTPSRYEYQQQLEALLRTPTSPELDSFLTTAPAEELAAAAAIELRPVLSRIPLEMARSSLRLQALRAIAVSRSDHSREEIASHLYEVVVQLLDEPSLEWAAVTAQYWLDLVLSRSIDPLEATRRSATLLDEHPDLVQRTPLLAAIVAAHASFYGERETADRLWRQALNHPELEHDSDQYWKVQLRWAAAELGPCQGNLPEAQLLLSRARGHFAARTDADSADQMHIASMNLAFTRFVSGASQEAAAELENDIQHFEPGSMYEAFLRLLSALVQADGGQVETAQRLLAACEATIPTNNPTALLAGLGPCRMIIAARTGDLAALQDAIAQVTRVEIDRPNAVEDEVTWRVIAGRCLLALDQRAAAMRLLTEAVQLCESKRLPYLHAWSLLLRSDAGHDVEDAAAALELAATHSLYDLMTRREPRRGAIALLQVVQQGRAPQPFTIRALNLIGPEAASQALRNAGAADLANDPAVTELLDELGWRGGPESAISRLKRPNLEVRLLGELRVFRNGQDITTSAEWRNRRQAKLLLARLLLARGVPLHRDRVADELWGEVDIKRASRNLAPVAHTLRRVLQPEQDLNIRGATLETGDASYTLKLGPGDRCDLYQFLEAADQAVVADGDQAAAACARALALYRGEFLAGEGYARWIVEAREHLRSIWRDVVLRLAQLELAVGDIVKARDALEQLWRDEPSCEEACRMLMQVRASGGDIAGASSIYHRTMAHLSNDLGLRPSRETRELYSRLVAR